jgi:hypothetical protein
MSEQQRYTMFSTTDACGGTFHDTVALIQELPIDCSVGLERIKCNADTVRINVPTDF